jgi:hypothetical protein
MLYCRVDASTCASILVSNTLAGDASTASTAAAATVHGHHTKRIIADVVIVGTNLVHSIVASACARAGKSALHCDGNDFYGETGAVFSLDGLIQWSIKHSLRDQDDKAVNTSSIDSQTKHGLMLEPMGTFASFRIHSASHSTSPRHALLDVGTEVVTPFGQSPGRIGFRIHAGSINTDP